MKKITLFIINYDRPELGFVRAKNYLAGHDDRRPAVCYFQPCKGWLCLLYTADRYMQVNFTEKKGNDIFGKLSCDHSIQGDHYMQGRHIQVWL